MQGWRDGWWDEGMQGRRDVGMDVVMEECMEGGKEGWWDEERNMMPGWRNAGTEGGMLGDGDARMEGEREGYRYAGR